MLHENAGELLTVKVNQQIIIFPQQAIWIFLALWKMGGRHLIIFEKTDEPILIVRILHEAMDIPRHISSMT